MKTKIKILLLALTLVLAFIALKTNKEKVLTLNLHFNESTLPYGDGVLIANFGSDELNPLNQEGKGYIAYLKEGKISTFIPATGALNAPKGMMVLNDTLYVCDVNKLVVFDLKTKENIKNIIFPEGELYLNDIAECDDKIYVSVTNSGNIFSLNKADLAPTLWHNTPGANGILISENSMFVASYPANGVTSSENVIYKIESLENPQNQMFIQTPGQWDGLAISDDKQTLYASNWSPAELYKIDINTKKIDKLKFKTSFVGAADFSLINGKLYVPDLVNSTLIIKEVN
ncbi:MAG: hypothetical protein R3Y38_07070 [Rikenellaceae bacterium]